MTRTKDPKPSAAKFLALLASITMLVSGLVSVGLATPASATGAVTVTLHNGQGTQATGNETDCGNTEGQDGWHFVIAGPGQAYFDPASFQATFDDGGNPAAGVSWTQTGTQKGNAPDGFVKGIYVSTAHGAYLRAASVQAFDAEEGTLLNLSHTCGGSDEPEVTTEHAYWCANFELQHATRTTTDGKVGDWTPVTPPEGYKTSDDLDCNESTTAFAYWCDGTIEKSASRTTTNGILGDWIPVTPPEGYSATSGLNCAPGNPPCTTCGSSNPPGNPPAAPPIVTPVVAAATIPVAQAVVLPATVVPAKPKPAKAITPASVPAGVAKLPVAATVPGSVPAGNGPANPALPMWALTMIALGALGAAGAGMRIRSDRT